MTQYEAALSSLPSSGAKHVGVALRMIDVPALLRGYDDVFDRSPAKLTPAERTAWRTCHIEALLKGCRRNQGKAFLAYIRKLSTSRVQSTIAARKYIADFEKQVRRSLDDDAARDLARRSGVMYAGNCLARDFGVVKVGHAMKF